MEKLAGRWKWLIAISGVLGIIAFLYIKFSGQGEIGDDVTWVG